MYAALVADGARPVTDVVGVMRSAVDTVLNPHLGLDHRWELWWSTRADDLSRPQPQRGLIWDAVLAVDALENLSVMAVGPESLFPEHSPSTAVAQVSADLPRPVRRSDGSQGLAPPTVAFSVPLAALAGPGLTAEAGGAAVAWLLDAAEALDACSGYLTLDMIDAAPGSPSPYEVAVLAAPGARDARTRVLGYGWGVVLGPTIVAALGGQDVVAAAPVARKVRWHGGRWWLDLGGNPVTDDPPGRRRLREFLGPVLPRGSRTLEEYAAPPAPGTAVPPYRV